MHCVLCLTSDFILKKNFKLQDDQGQQHYIDNQHMIDLIDESTQCRQYIRFDCLKSPLLKGLNKAKDNHIAGARWLSRDSVIMNYWGGSDEKSETCKCGMDNTCDRKCRNHYTFLKKL